MATRRSRDSLGEKKTNTAQNRRSVTLTTGDERVVRGKGSMRDGPRDEKADSATDQSIASPARSGTTGVEHTPKRGRGRPRKSVSHDKDHSMSSVEVTSEPLFGLTDTESVRRGKGPVTVPRRTLSSGRQSDGHNNIQSESQSPETECNSQLKNTQSSERKGSLQIDGQNEFHGGKQSISDDTKFAESVVSPPVRRRGRPRKSQSLETNGQTNQLTSSKETAAVADTTDSDNRFCQPGTVDQNNKNNVNVTQSPVTTNHIPEKRMNDSMVDGAQVTLTGGKRGRRSKTHDESIESASHGVQCSTDKQLGSSNDISPPVKRKRGRPKKTASAPVEMQPESKQNVNLASDTSDEEYLVKKERKGRAADDELMVESSTTRRGPKRRGRFKGRIDQELMEEEEDVSEEEGGHVIRKKKQPKVDSKEQRTCAQCKEEFPTMRDMKTHLLHTHHLIWTPQKPEGVSNLAKLFRILGKMACPKCGKETRFPQYYKFHEKWCGREEEMTDCALCGRTLKSMYLTQHMHASHTPKTPKVKVKPEVKVIVDEEEVASTTPTGRVRRKAATKAINHMKNLDKADEFQTEVAKIHKYTTVPHVTPEDIMIKFREQLKAGGKAKCCFEGCSVTNSSGIWASRHYHRCPHAPPEVTAESFQCVQCGAIFKNKSDIETHVKKHSWKSQVYAPDTDDSADSYVSDNDTSSSDPEFDSEASLSDSNVKQTAARRVRTGGDSKGDVHVKKKKPSKPTDRCGYPTHQLTLLTPQTLPRHIFPSAYPWTLAFRKSLQLTGVWPEWRPKVADWTLVDDVAPYLPVSELSPSFCVKQKKKVKVPPTRLPLFDAVLHGDATFNVGGPIWAAAWCPVPVSETGRQYLAVYCHRHRDDTHIVEKCLDTSTALLQVWDCGPLQTGSISEKPQLYVAVATDYGAIWDMAWCLNGAWDGPDMKSQNGCLPRLGLLALACADGMVHVLSIPHPRCLTEGRPEGQLPVYTVKSCLDLLPKCSPDEVGSQCLCVDWTCHEGHSLVAAGFADGTVALWDLHSRSSLLYTSSPTEGATLRACVNFIAHPTRTTGIKFCPPNPQFFGTCSNDRTTKTWDMNDLQCPLNKTICSQMTSIAWPLYWSLTYVSGDDCYCFGHNAMQVIDNGYYGTHVRPLSTHSSCIWDVSNSDWLNTVCSVSSVGEVTGIWLPDMAYSYLRMKGLPFRRFFISKTTLEELSDDDHHKEEPQSQQMHAGRRSASTSGRGNRKHGVSRSEGSDLRTSCTVSTEGGASGAGGESTLASTHTITPTSTDTRNNTTDKNRTKRAHNVSPGSVQHSKGACDNNVSDTDGHGDHCVEESMNSSGDTSRTTETPNCDSKKVTGGGDTGFRLVYYDVDMTRVLDSSCERASYPKDMQHDQLDKPPWLALHKVCWNPNRGSHLWLAVGGHAGLVRLRHLTGLQSKNT